MTTVWSELIGLLGPPDSRRADTLMRAESGACAIEITAADETFTQVTAVFAEVMYRDFDLTQRLDIEDLLYQVQAALDGRVQYEEFTIGSRRVAKMVTIGEGARAATYRYGFRWLTRVARPSRVYAYLPHARP